MLTAIAALALLGTASGAGAAPWPVPHNGLATDGPINGMAALGDMVYVTGDFHRIGRFTGSGVALDGASGALNQSFPAPNGQVSYVVSDGQGGWYIGGDFTEVGGIPRAGVAHIYGDGMVDPSFAPTADGLVDSLALAGNTLYLGGFFTTVDGQPRGGLAAVDAHTGALLPFDARQTGHATKLTFLPATSSHPAVLYAGMGQVLALDPTTGDPVPGFNSDIQDDIHALAVNDQHLYVGGNGLVAVDPMTGVQDPRFQPTPTTLTGASALTGQIREVVVQPGRILVGGTFNALGGASGPLVALDPNTGQADRNFRPQIAGTIYSMDQSGNTLWIGGAIKSVAGRPATNLVALDATTGARIAQVNPPAFDGQVNEAKVSGSQVYAGGQFFMVGYAHRRGFAAFQAGTLALDPSFQPPAPRNQTITAGGGRLVSSQIQFQGYDPTAKRPPFYPTSRSTIQVLNPATGLPSRRFPLDNVKNLSGVTASRDELFVSQRIESKVRFPHNVVTVYDIRTGTVRHRFEVPLPGYVSRLAVANGRLYAAGSFKRTRPSGQLANLAIVALNPQNGALDSSFDPHAHGPVYSLAPCGRALYFAGLFDKAQGVPRPSLAAVKLADGSLVASFDPRISGGNFTQLTSFPQDIFFENPFRVRFLNPATGKLDRSAGAHLQRFITAASATNRGLAIAAEIITPLDGYDEDSLDFVRMAER